LLYDGKIWPKAVCALILIVNRKNPGSIAAVPGFAFYYESADL